MIRRIRTRRRRGRRPEGYQGGIARVLGEYALGSRDEGTRY